MVTVMPTTTVQIATTAMTVTTAIPTSLARSAMIAMHEAKKEWKESFDLDGDDFCVKFKFFLANILKDYDVKMLWQVGENDKLHNLKDKIYHEVREGEFLTDTH